MIRHLALLLLSQILPDPAVIYRLAERLDAPRFSVRERAQQELSRLGYRAVPALMKLRGEDLPAESASRVRQLLALHGVRSDRSHQDALAEAEEVAASRWTLSDMPWLDSLWMEPERAEIATNGCNDLYGNAPAWLHDWIPDLRDDDAGAPEYTRWRRGTRMLVVELIARGVPPDALEPALIEMRRRDALWLKVRERQQTRSNPIN